MQLEQELTQAKLHATRLKHYATCAGAGLWDVELVNGDPSNENNKSYYTPRFRQLIGYQNESDFPNTAEAWIKVLHPEDINDLFAAFAAHLQDRSGATKYNHDFRMKTKQGQYRWFNVQGDCIRNSSGVAEFASGSVVDIHDGKISQLEQEQNTYRKDALIDNVSTVVMQVSQSMNTNSIELEQVNQQIEHTRDSIEKGDGAVNQMSALIHRVSDKNSEIISIVERIQGIAEQTNLLALNAAIESARAGEQGRGFAVVADEVRQLAHNSAQSSKEITDLVANVAADSQASVEISAQVIGNMQDISTAVAELQDSISQSSRDITENKQKVEQITGMMSEL